MSEEQLIEVVSKALIDSDFRTSLVNEPESAVEDYDLTDEDMQLLKKFKFETNESMSTELEERVSRAGLNLADMNLPGDSSGERSQQLQLELQDAMNKQQQAMQTLSNIMKNQHDTIKAIIQNMR